MEGNNPYLALTDAIVQSRKHVFYQRLTQAITVARSKKKLINPYQPINTYGRPTVMTNDVLEKLKQAFLFGCTDIQACAFAGIVRQTMYNYEKENPDFLDMKSEWKENPILKAKATVYNKLGETETAKWYLERKAKDEFSTRQETIAKDEALLKKEQELEEEVEAEDDVVTKIKEQMVEIKPPVQNKEQTG
jgi:hypothetical protein